MQFRNLIDNHIHIDLYSEEELDDICSSASKLFAVSTNYDSALRLIEINKKFPNVKIAFGIHPEYFNNYNEFEKIKELIIKYQSKIYAIGEVGLPYFYLDKLERSKRKEIEIEGEKLFIKFVKLSKILNLPLQIHGTGKSTKKVVKILESYQVEKALFHWLYTDFDLHKSLIEKGYYYSISLDYLFNKNYEKYIDKLPFKNFLLESDGPWSYEEKSKSYPKDIIKVINKLSKNKGISKGTIIELNNSYNKKIFGG